MAISLIGLQTIGEIKEGDDLVRLIGEACEREGVPLEAGDVIVITSKIVSKAEGRTADLNVIVPSKKAKAIARMTGKDPVEVEAILRESINVVAVVPVWKVARRFPRILDNITTDRAAAEKVMKTEPTLLVTVTKQGLLASDAAIDYSNNQPGKCSQLPLDPSASARRIRDGLAKMAGGDLAVVITDTEIAYTHLYGSTEVAVGSSGISPVARGFAARDRFGKEKFGGVDIVVDEVACAAALLMGQTAEGIPVVVIKGLKYAKGDDLKPTSFPLEALRYGIKWTFLATIKLRLLWFLRVLF
jgi:coenzyme F420-0:L-glutamate ligase/coenzyme F420-1:gamma-L-glutamate ligase